MIGVRTFPSFMIAAAALFASMVPGAAALLIEKHNTVVYLPLAQGAIYAVFTFLLLREKHGLTEEQSRRYFVYLLGFGIVMRAMLLFAPPHSSDIYRYVWDGRVQAHGINPYRYIPADPALARLRDADIYSNINRREFAPTIYPPAAQAVFFAVSRLSESVTMMKAAMLAVEALAVWALIRASSRAGLAGHPCVALLSPPLGGMGDCWKRPCGCCGRRISSAFPACGGKGKALCVRRRPCGRRTYKILSARSSTGDLPPLGLADACGIHRGSSRALSALSFSWKETVRLSRRLC